jgi:hypothetical protein
MPSLGDSPAYIDRDNAPLAKAAKEFRVSGENNNQNSEFELRTHNSELITQNS